MSDLPPIDPRDLRNRGQRNPNSYPPGDHYPPTQQNSGYPPPGNSYPPQGGNYPPAGQGGGSYPPQGGGSSYPPQRPPDYPPPTPPDYRPPAPQPVQPSAPPPRPRYEPLDEPSIPPARGGYDSGLDDLGPPDLRRRVREIPPETRQDDPLGSSSRRNRSDTFRSGSVGGGYSQMLLTERQVEALGWGVTVILLGVAILLFFTGSSDFLTIGFPILGGLILMSSSVYQRLHGWRVSILTWLTAIGLTAFSITRFIAIADGRDTGLGRSLAYFFGISIIITGIIVLIRIFRHPQAR